MAKVDAYRKWFGLHWRLVTLADFGRRVDREAIRKALDAGIDRELDWIAKPRNLESHPKLKNGLYLSDASMEDKCPVRRQPLRPSGFVHKAPEPAGAGDGHA